MLFYFVRAFGHFEKPLFMELCKHVETKFVPIGALLFKPGLQDDSIYVVKNGCLKVYILEPVREIKRERREEREREKRVKKLQQHANMS